MAKLWTLYYHPYSSRYFQKTRMCSKKPGKARGHWNASWEKCCFIPVCCTLLCFECFHALDTVSIWQSWKVGPNRQDLGRGYGGYSRLWVSLVEIGERSEHPALGGILRCAHLTSIFFTVNWHMWGPYWCAHPSQPPKIQTRRTPWFQASQGYIVNPVSKLNPWGSGAWRWGIWEVIRSWCGSSWMALEP